MSRQQKEPKDSRHYGIGEWYGKSFVRLAPEDRRRWAEIALAHYAGEKSKIPACPFRSTPGSEIACSKKGGVCSIREYLKTGSTGNVTHSGTLRTTCPLRFLQSETIFNWVGQELLGCEKPLVLSQIGFLERQPPNPDRARRTKKRTGPEEYEEVGRIDHVLVHPSRKPLDWCALEIQAVYFSGRRMDLDFKAIRDDTADTLPFPFTTRRPDYRSSGPKRLLPQLLLKVEQLSRWARKMAVVVD